VSLDNRFHLIFLISKLRIQLNNNYNNKNQVKMNLLKHLNMEMIYVKNILCNGLIIITKK
jgi:hypothetical protein